MTVVILCSNPMLELEQFWSAELERLAQNARANGRTDVSAYLELRMRNDVVRQTGIQWLAEAMIAASEEASGRTNRIETFREQPHRFSLNNSTMVGIMLNFQQGVRCLTLEAGWTRTPGDGIMRGGALASARLKHLGLPKLGIELGLAKKDESLNWLIVDEGRMRSEFGLEQIADHFRILLG